MMLLVEDSHLLRLKTPLFSVFETLDFLPILRGRGGVLTFGVGGVECIFFLFFHK